MSCAFQSARSSTSWPRQSRSLDSCTCCGSSFPAPGAPPGQLSRLYPELSVTEALIGLLAMMALAFIRIPIALSMGIVGVVGYAYMRDWNWSPALAMVQTQIYETGRNYT